MIGSDQGGRGRVAGSQVSWRPMLVSCCRPKCHPRPFPPLHCDPRQMPCDVLGCVARERLCDGREDCLDGSDEQHCSEGLHHALEMARGFQVWGAHMGRVWEGLGQQGMERNCKATGSTSVFEGNEETGIDIGSQPVLLNLFGCWRFSTIRQSTFPLTYLIHTPIHPPTYHCSIHLLTYLSSTCSF